VTQRSINDPLAIEQIEQRERIERQDAAFVERLRRAILHGDETAQGVLGRMTGPRRTFLANQRTSGHKLTLKSSQKPTQK
jgi:hypothetical protein